MIEERNPKGWNLQVQAWHVLILLAVQLVGLGVAYGRITEKQDELTRQLATMEGQRTITKDEFDDWKSQLISRMDRMENKIDREIFRKDLDGGK